MRVWRYQGVHRLAWVVLALLVLAVAVFAMAAGFSQLHHRAHPEPFLRGDYSRLPPAALEATSLWTSGPTTAQAPRRLPHGLLPSFPSLASLAG